MIRAVSARVVEFCRTHQDVSYAAALALLTVMLTFPVLRGRASLGPEAFVDKDPIHQRAKPVPRVPTFHDPAMVQFDYPRELAIAKGLRSGRIDQWTPDVAFGSPLWAEQGGPFFPLKAPFYVAPSPYTFNLFLIIRILFAAFGAYLLARQRGLAPAPAWCAAALFQVSGTMVAQLAFTTGNGFFVLPWVLLAAQMIADDKSLRNPIIGAVALFLAGIGGHPTIGVMVFIAFCLAIAGHSIASWRKPLDGLQIAGRGMIAVAIGAGLTMLVLLPLLELREVGVSYKHTGVGDHIWRRTMELSRASVYLSALAPATMEIVRPWSWNNWPWGMAPALGILGLTLSLAGIMRRGLSAGLVAVLILGVSLAIAPSGLGWVHKLPGMHLIMPNYAWVLITLPLTQAAGNGIAELDTKWGRRCALIALAVVVGSVVWLLLARTNVGRKDEFGRVLIGAIKKKGYWPVLWPVASASIVIGACYALGRTRFRRYAIVAVGVVAVAEMFVIMRPLVSQPTSRVLRSGPGPAVQFLQRKTANGLWRTTGMPKRAGGPNMLMIYGVPDLRSVSALPVGRYIDYLNAIQRMPGLWNSHTNHRGVSPLLDLAAVRYVVVEKREKRWMKALTRDPQHKIVHQAKTVVIFENMSALPRVRIASRVIGVADQKAAKRRIWHFGRSGHIHKSKRNDVVLEPAADGTEPPKLTHSEQKFGSVTIVKQPDPDRLVLDVQLEQPGYVFVADTYYPGWRATVDGEIAPIFPANLAFRAVYVPQGKHRVVFQYRSKPLRNGVLLFLLSCFVLAGLFYLHRQLDGRAGAAGEPQPTPEPKLESEPDSEAVAEQAEDALHSSS